MNLSQFFIVVSQLQTARVVAAYVAFVLFGAPLWKRCTRPLRIPSSILVAHNTVCVLLSLYCSIYPLAVVISSGSIFSLESGDPRLSRAFFIYWVSKTIELFDTFFMVLRHSFRQLTFLHVFHHSTMALLSDYAYHYSPWPAVAFPLGMNSVVHVVLYSYYGFSAWRPQNLPAWRRHITELQILQFVIGLIQAYFGYKYHGFCIYGQFYAVTMIILFGNFYIRAYILKKPKKEEKVHVS